MCEMPSGVAGSPWCEMMKRTDFAVRRHELFEPPFEVGVVEDLGRQVEGVVDLGFVEGLPMAFEFSCCSAC